MSGEIEKSGLNILYSHLTGLAEATKNSKALAIFNEDGYLQGLNLKTFMQTVHFLLKVISQTNAERLPWPVRSVKERDVFMREFFHIVEELKKQYPTMLLSRILKSHFLNPRPENKKVVGLLLQLSTLAIYKVTGSLGDTRTPQQLQMDIERLELNYVEASQNVGKLQKELREMIENKQQCPILLDRLKHEVLKAGFVDTVEKVTLLDLMEVKKHMELEMARQISLVQEDVLTLNETG